MIYAQRLNLKSYFGQGRLIIEKHNFIIVIGNTSELRIYGMLYVQSL